MVSAPGSRAARGLPVLEDEHQQAVGRADAQEVGRDRRQRDRQRAERDHEHEEAQAQHEREDQRRAIGGDIGEVELVGGLAAHERLGPHPGEGLRDVALAQRLDRRDRGPARGVRVDRDGDAGHGAARRDVDRRLAVGGVLARPPAAGGSRPRAARACARPRRRPRPRTCPAARRRPRSARTRRGSGSPPAGSRRRPCRCRSRHTGSASATRIATPAARLTAGRRSATSGDSRPDPVAAASAGDAQPLDPVAEDGERRRQQRQRGEHRDQHDRDRAHRDRAEDRLRHEEHPEQREHDRGAGEQHRAARRGARDRDRVVRRRARPPAPRGSATRRTASSRSRRPGPSSRARSRRRS